VEFPHFPGILQNSVQADDKEKRQIQHILVVFWRPLKINYQMFKCVQCVVLSDSGGWLVPNGRSRKTEGTLPLYTTIPLWYHYDLLWNLERKKYRYKFSTYNN